MSMAEFIAYEARHNRVAVNSDGVDDETGLHKSVMDFCNGQWPRWKFIHSRMDTKSTIAVGAQDFTIFLPGGKTMCIELKAARGKLSIAQLAWRKEMEMLGHVVHVIASMKEFLALCPTAH